MTVEILETRAGSTRWVYAGFEIVATWDLSESRDFANLDQQQRTLQAFDLVHGWLERITPLHTPVELRYLNTAGRVRAAVLVRLANPTEQQLQHWLRCAGEGPGFCTMAPIPRRDLHGWFVPFVADPNGRFELRRQVYESLPNRPDADSDRYLSTSVLTPTGRHWAAIVRALSSRPDGVMLSVGVQRTPVPQQLHSALDGLATWFGRLGETARWHGGLGLAGTERQVSADVHAQHAARELHAVADELRNAAYLYRISLASSSPMGAHEAASVAMTLTQPDAATQDSTRSRPSGLCAVQPAHHDDVVAFDQNTSALDFVPWNPRRDLTGRFAALADATRLLSTREAAGLFRPPIAETGSIQGFQVIRPVFAVASAFAEATGAVVTIGRQRADSSPVTVPVESFSAHAFIVGTTGSGKTTTLLSILYQLWLDHQVPWMVIEPVNSVGNDYRWFLDQRGFESTVVVVAGSDDAPLRINPFQVPTGTTVGEHVSALLSCFDAAFGLWDPLPAIYRVALTQTYFEAGFTLDDTGTPTARYPTVRDFVTEMRHATEGLDYAGEVRSNIIAASRVRAEQLLTGPLRAVFDCTTSTPIERLLANPCVIELARIGASNEQESAFVISLLLTVIGEYRRSQPASRALRHVTVVEEAHKLIRNPTPAAGDTPQGDTGAAAARQFANLLAEVRKYGEGLIIADQDPSKLVPDVYKNTNLKIMHRLPAEHDREVVGATMRFAEDHLKEAAVLPAFDAFVYAPHIDRPALVTVNNIRANSNAPLAQSDVTTRFRAVTSGEPGFEAALRPYAQCGPCAEPCRHRTWAHATASRRTAIAEFSALRQLPASDRTTSGRAMIDRLAGDRSLSGARCLALHLAMHAFDDGFDPVLHAFGFET